MEPPLITQAELATQPASYKGWVMKPLCFIQMLPQIWLCFHLVLPQTVYLSVRKQDIPTKSVLQAQDFQMPLSLVQMKKRLRPFKPFSLPSLARSELEMLTNTHSSAIHFLFYILSGRRVILTIAILSLNTSQ